MDPADWLWAWQDDVVSLAAALGLRADDHGDTPETGSAMAAYTGSLPAGQTRVVASGVVEMNGMSWPGLCPPVPLWRSCPPYPPEDDGYPPVGTDDLGQNVVFALARDFFRFNVGATTSPVARGSRSASMSSRGSSMPTSMRTWKCGTCTRAAAGRT
jgi:hypothetical protein